MTPALAVWVGFLFGALVGSTVMWVAMWLLAKWEHEAILDLLRRHGVIR